MGESNGTYYLQKWVVLLQILSPHHVCTSQPKTSVKADHCWTAACLVFNTQGCDFYFFLFFFLFLILFYFYFIFYYIKASTFSSSIRVLAPKDTSALSGTSWGHRPCCQCRNVVPAAAGLVLVLFWPKLWGRNETRTTIYSSEIAWIKMKIVP